MRSMNSSARIEEMILVHERYTWDAVLFERDMEASQVKNLGTSEVHDHGSKKI